MNRYTPIIAGKPCTMLSREDRDGAAASCRDRFCDRFEGFEDDAEIVGVDSGTTRKEPSVRGHYETGQRSANQNSGTGTGDEPYIF